MVITEAGVSGTTKPEDRPGFARVLQLAQERAFSVLLVWKLDRLSRNLIHAVTTVYRLQEEHGAAVRSDSEPIHTATPMGRMICSVLAGMAEQEREAIVRRTLAGKREKARQGGFAGGAAPLGYKRDKGGGLVINPAEAAIVRRSTP